MNNKGLLPLLQRSTSFKAERALCCCCSKALIFWSSRPLSRRSRRISSNTSSSSALHRQPQIKLRPNEVCISCNMLKNDNHSLKKKKISTNLAWPTWEGDWGSGDWAGGAGRWGCGEGDKPWIFVMGNQSKIHLY